jgi:serine protease Do
MRMFCFLLAFIFGSSVFAQSGGLQNASRSVVRIAAFSTANGEKAFVGHGSGVVVAPGKIVTNAHVVEQAQYDSTMTFMVIPSAGKSGFEAELLDYSPDNDLALLKFSGGNIATAQIYSGNIVDGADVFAIGYPANVDIALQDSEDENLHPQSPVKTRGNVSTGRSSKMFDSILHTAPIAPGSSGGPLVDNCGRLVGINSFGANNAEGGAEFYFAISARELSAFLRKNGVIPRTTSEPCRSAAEISDAEIKKTAAVQKRVIADQQAADVKQQVEERFRKEVEYGVIEQRENGLALAALLLVLSAVGGIVTWQEFDREKRAPMVFGAVISTALAIAALFAFLVRPGFDQVEARTKERMAAANVQTSAALKSAGDPVKK